MKCGITRQTELPEARMLFIYRARLVYDFYNLYFNLSTSVGSYTAEPKRNESLLTLGVTVVPVALRNS